MKKTKDQLKETFETGTILTESKMSDLIDSMASTTEAENSPFIISATGISSFGLECGISPANGTLQMIILEENTEFIFEGWDDNKFGNLTLIIKNLNNYDISMPNDFWKDEVEIEGSEAIVEIFKLPGANMKGVLVYVH